jgi:hypothetical protein
VAEAAPKISIPWRAQDGPQLEAIKKHWVGELFFGGAVGGGKSDYLLGDFAQDVPTYGANWHGVVFRKSYPQLEELMARSKEIYPAWFGMSKDCWSATEKTWKWPTGSTLKMRHAENDDSWMEYQGHAYGWMGYDELPHWATPTFYRQMKTRLRNGGMAIPNKRIRGTGNPGGVGHGWIKSEWAIDRHPLGSVLLPPDVVGGASKMFVRSCLTDNKILLKNDPEYIARLQNLGSPELVKMYLDGDWNVIAGAYFPEFNIARHVIHPFEIPRGWVRFRALDWGSAKPFCVLWFAVSDGSVYPYPPGALICYREYYGMKPNEPNVGIKLTAEEVADGIKEREDRGEKIDMSHADPSIAKEDGGPSIMSKMSGKKVYFQKADNSRITGWDSFRSRLKGIEDRDQFTEQLLMRPMIYFFTTCEDTIRTVPMLQHSTTKPEDADSDGEDHAADTVRYACMARPWIRPGEPPRPPPAKYDNAKIITTTTTFNELVAASRQRRISRDRGF